MNNIYDSRACLLGEGPLWHPQRKQLFWFDVINNRMLSRVGDTAFDWLFDQQVSAAAWVDDNSLLVASEKALLHFDIASGATQLITELESDSPLTRCNDGRADPYGGFWIGTMGKQAEQGAGAIYRYYRGELRQLHGEITIPNAICFSPEGDWSYFTDTARQIIWKQPLDMQGWPTGQPEQFLDFKPDGLFPDGCVVDSEGCLWNAQWGSGSVACYSANGRFLSRHPVGGTQSSCPAFGGDLLNQLFVTTAQQGIENPSSSEGCVYQLAVEVTGVAEPQVVL